MENRISLGFEFGNRDGAKIGVLSFNDIELKVRFRALILHRRGEGGGGLDCKKERKKLLGEVKFAKVIELIRRLVEIDPFVKKPTSKKKQPAQTRFVKQETHLTR